MLGKEGINQYDFFQQIGSGGWGKVVSAFDTKEHRKVAVKIVPKEHLIECNAEETIINEALMMRKLNHPNIASFIEIIENESFYFLVMELCEGINMWQWIISQEKVSDNVIDCIMKQITSAILYLHSKNIAHGDIKLENFIIDPRDNKVKLVDFGYSSQVYPGQLITSNFCSISYSPPEIFYEEAYDPYKADMWSLGVTFYTIQCLCQPFYAETEDEEIELIKKGEFKLPEKLSATARKFILMTLNVSPEMRIDAEMAYSMFHPKKGVTTSPIRYNKRTRLSSYSFMGTIPKGFDTISPTSNAAASRERLPKLHRASIV